jgi:hypothetical protein
MKRWLENWLCRVFHQIQKQDIPGVGHILFCKPCKRRVKG